MFNINVKSKSKENYFQFVCLSLLLSTQADTLLSRIVSFFYDHYTIITFLEDTRKKQNNKNKSSKMYDIIRIFSQNKI